MTHVTEFDNSFNMDGDITESDNDNVSASTQYFTEIKYHNSALTEYNLNYYYSHQRNQIACDICNYCVLKEKLGRHKLTNKCRKSQQMLTEYVISNMGAMPIFPLRTTRVLKPRKVIEIPEQIPY